MLEFVREILWHIHSVYMQYIEFQAWTLIIIWTDNDNNERLQRRAQKKPVCLWMVIITGHHTSVQLSI